MADELRTTFRFNDTEADMAVQLRRPDSVESQAVRELTGHEDLSHAPAATLLRTIVEAGIKAIQEQAEKIRYQQLAEFLKNDEEYKAWRASRMTRRARRLGRLGEEA